MIISSKYRYLFIELPLTASTAIAKELTENYAGQTRHYKHATYRTFLKSATDEEKSYFTFIGIRNPLDQAVSHYYKYLNDHKGKYSNPQPRRSGRVKYWLNERGHQKRYRFIHEQKADFAQFFLKFYTRPYLDWSLMDQERMDSVIRFEHIQEDFQATLEAIGIEAVRPLPIVNQTRSKEKTFWEYYDSLELRVRAARVFGPYLEQWDYALPAEWDVQPEVKAWESRFQRDLKLKKMYWSILT
ncbi:MAG: sulfotransferase family 2 domain-containing protein [Flavobacteriales bacterium]|nr:sulfotransferase family 2 domain-containing protein [Flavobacteriales bacterium]